MFLSEPKLLVTAILKSSENCPTVDTIIHLINYMKKIKFLDFSENVAVNPTDIRSQFLSNRYVRLTATGTGTRLRYLVWYLVPVRRYRGYTF